MRLVVKVTRNYQITIPAEIRRKFGIREGDILSVEVRGNEIVIKKITRKRKRIKLGKKLYPEDIERSIEAAIKECVQ